MAMEFKSGDMTRITGVKLARLQQWWAAGYVDPPSISVAQGAGSRNIFSLYDLSQIMFFKTCVESGLPRESIKKFINFGIGKEKAAVLAKGLEIDFETYKREGRNDRPTEGISRVYAVFFRKGKEVINSTVLTATGGKLSVPDMISDADDFIGINIQKIFIELFEKIDA